MNIGGVRRMWLKAEEEECKKVGFQKVGFRLIQINGESGEWGLILFLAE